MGAPSASKSPSALGARALRACQRGLYLWKAVAVKKDIGRDLLLSLNTNVLDLVLVILLEFSDNTITIKIINIMKLQSYSYT